MYTEHAGDGYSEGGTYGEPLTEASEGSAEGDNPAVVEGVGAAEALLAELSEATRSVVRTAEEIADRVREEAQSTLSSAQERAAEIEDEIRADVEERMNEARAEHMDQIADLRATKERLADEIETLEGRREDLVGEALRLADQLRSLGTPTARSEPAEDEQDAGPTVAHLFAAEAAESPDGDLLAHAAEHAQTWGAANE